MLSEEGTFGQRLRRARLEAALSQSDLEGRSGIPKARLSRYENGHVLPSITTLRRLAEALGVSEASLLGDQRAMVDEFFAVLFQRRVHIQSAEHARKLAHAVADMYETLGLGLDGQSSSAQVAAGPVVEATAEAPPVP
jgi:transcriptional regulator with XRE-family HTH domain